MQSLGRFSRAAFLAADDPHALAGELSSVLTARLHEADDAAREEEAFVRELVALGHPLVLFDSQQVQDLSGSTWCDDWHAPSPLGGSLVIETAYRVGVKHSGPSTYAKVEFQSPRHEPRPAKSMLPPPLALHASPGKIAEREIGTTYEPRARFVREGNFCWFADDAKDQESKGVLFEEAALVFFDPSAVYLEGAREGELRAVGRSVSRALSVRFRLVGRRIGLVGASVADERERALRSDASAVSFEGRRITGRGTYAGKLLRLSLAAISRVDPRWGNALQGPLRAVVPLPVHSDAEVEIVLRLGEKRILVTNT